MDAAAGTLVGRSRGRSLRRPAGFAALAAGLLAIAGYLSVSFVVGERFSTAERYRVDRSPMVAASRYEDVRFRTSDGITLRGWYFPVDTDRAAIVAHGRNGNRIGGQERTQEHIADALIADGFSVLLFDLRGHGESEGQRYTLGLLERIDLSTAIEYVIGRGMREERIALIGISMGAGTVLHTLPWHPKVGAVVADSSYSTLRNALEDGLEYVTGLPAWLTPGVLLTMRVALGLDGDQVRPVEVVRAHPERTFLFIHCDVDQMVPLHQATELRAAANASSELWVAAGCQHAWAYNDHPAEWESRVLAFLDKQISR